MSDLQRDIAEIEAALEKVHIYQREDCKRLEAAWQRLKLRLTPDREAAEREAADIEAIRFARRAAGLLHGFMLDTNAIGAREAGVNLAHSIKEALQADAAIKAMEGNDDA